LSGQPTAIQRYWNALDELITHCYYLEAYCQRSIKHERVANVVLALAGTGSLGMWAVFKQYPHIWGGIIVLTQIISSVSGYLPFAARVKRASTAAHEYRSHQVWAEHVWCQIVEGELTVSEINKARLDLKTKTSSSLREHFPEGGLPAAPDLHGKAQEQSYIYLDANFGDQTDEK
jgi:hypothetical protein